MRKFLDDVSKTVQKAGGKLEAKEEQQRRQQYRDILTTADTECPEPIRTDDSPKRGRLKRSKSRNLLERHINYEDDVLRFMGHVSFTNNQG
jgi:transposase